VPPERVGGREHGDEHTGGEDHDGGEGEVMDAVAYRRPGFRPDSHSACAARGEADFGCGEDGQGTLVLWLRRPPRRCPQHCPRRSSVYSDKNPQVSGTPLDANGNVRTFAPPIYGCTRLRPGVGRVLRRVR
jgi:hypothetical protein